MPISHDAALCILQQAAVALAHWADPTFIPPAFDPLPSTAVISSAIARAKEILDWSEQPLNQLQLVFDSIHLDRQPSSTPNYRPAWPLEIEVGETYPRIPYAQAVSPSSQNLDHLRSKIQAVVAELQWDNLAQLTLFVETFGSHLSVGSSNDIALIDLARSTAAVAAALVQQPQNHQLALIGGDLMGVQKFIYTISSEGALKSLRARSFYLELAAEEVVQQLLTALNLPRTNVIYAGASKFYLLVAATDGLDQIIQGIQAQFNDWLLETFQRKVFLAIALESFPAEQLKSVSSVESKTTPLTQIWQAVNDGLAKQANHKFARNLGHLLKPQPSYRSPCKVCHRDDVPEDRLKRLNELEDDSVLVCCTCQNMFRLGDRLPEVKALVRSSRQI